jgi:hypothetical protein
MRSFNKLNNQSLSDLFHNYKLNNLYSILTFLAINLVSIMCYIYYNLRCLNRGQGIEHKRKEATRHSVRNI